MATRSAEISQVTATAPCLTMWPPKGIVHPKLFLPISAKTVESHCNHELKHGEEEEGDLDFYKSLYLHNLFYQKIHCSYKFMQALGARHATGTCRTCAHECDSCLGGSSGYSGKNMVLTSPLRANFWTLG